tara:strand:- start:809 stop:1546 length:738 start_codon:yes stop_codon:yes gene_type:complete
MISSNAHIQQPTAAMLVIGDEILSGRTQDTNTQFIACKLTEAGIRLVEVRIVSDSHDEIVLAVNRLRSKYNYVFTSGGIGPTHDDITADAIADAFGVGINVREDAKRILSSNYSDGDKALNEARLRMARIPDEAILIENPVSKAPGFALDNVYVMAGVPEIFKVMVDSIIPLLTGGPPLLAISVKFFKPESEIAKRLEYIASNFSGGTIGSYPFSYQGVHGTNVVARHFDEESLKDIEAKLKELS